MDTRRDFIKKATLLSGAAGLSAIFPAAVLNAMSIDPALGSTYLDAEHIVVLMQENRSFDHCFGTLQGVRGFNDPRALKLATGNPVWFQQNAKGHTYAPFRLNIKDTKATWLGSLPHSWTNQVDARNNGKHDKWLDAKPSGYKGMEDAPLTMGYYNREDLPFYYAMADAFTVCDQNFCSSLTGTTPNRLYLWTGTARTAQNKDAPAMMRNENVDYQREATWDTFPELLEDHNISWKIYQNELSIDTGLTGEQDAWLTNFTDNPIEWFSQYKIRFSKTYRDNLEQRFKALPDEITNLEQKIAQQVKGSKGAIADEKLLDRKRALQRQIISERTIWTDEAYSKLSQKSKNLHEKAFCTNKNDPEYRSLTEINYKDGTADRKLSVPKGDTLYQFRKDVHTGQLPTVSWLVAPENFSDHPGAPWYGSWYVAEVMDILTKDPEVWKKTIFILCYDENDGYFDHVPPFVPPHPTQPDTGKVSNGIDVAMEYVTLAQDKQWNPTKDNRESPIGLGYRVPLVIASPWSRGGAVCSQVFDHTSILQFMEHFLTHKKGKLIQETNISAWRRAVCGNLTSAFSPFNGERVTFPKSEHKNEVIEQIYNAKYKKDPIGYKNLLQEEINAAQKTPVFKQEKGIRPAAALPYELYVDGKLTDGAFEINFTAGTGVFSHGSAGSPFIVHSKYHNIRNFAVSKGNKLTDKWLLAPDGNYHLEVYGPNGFYRKFTGKTQPAVVISCGYEKTVKNGYTSLTGNLLISISNPGNKPQAIEITDNSYHAAKIIRTIPSTRSGKPEQLVINLAKSHQWYDVSIKMPGNQDFEHQFAGKIETGKAGFTDPLMGNR